MANQVVTIIDNEGNNIYPVAGALMEGAVTTSTINDGAVTAAKIDFSSLPGNYSTTETATGYTWIDGKPIYRKCYTGDITITANTRVNVTLEESSSIENLINVGGYMGYYSGDPKGRNSIPSSECNTSGVMTNYIVVYLQAETNDLTLTRFSSADRGSQPYAVWVEYTKSS